LLLTIMLSAAALVAPTPAGGATPSQRFATPAMQDSAHYPKQTSPGRITLDVWPQWRDTVLIVQVRATTHSVDLASMNLSEQVRLALAGTEIAPLSAGRLSGHHAVTDVVFRLDTRPSSFAITIRDVPDVPVRTLTWPPR